MSNTHGLQFSALAEPGNDYSERGASRYVVVITKGKDTIRTKYSVGSGMKPSREMQRDFEDCQQNSKTLRRMLGSDWDSAMKEAQEA